MEIEKGILIPELRRGRPKSGLIMALEQMQVMESVFLLGARNSSSSVVAVASRTGRKFTQRKMDGGIRIWRIK